ncbi:hypothetical protein TNCV_1918291, partial [Trichonephila clavipes]
YIMVTVACRCGRNGPGGWRGAFLSSPKEPSTTGDLPCRGEKSVDSSNASSRWCGG